MPEAQLVSIELETAGQRVAAHRGGKARPVSGRLKMQEWHGLFALGVEAELAELDDLPPGLDQRPIALLGLARLVGPDTDEATDMHDRIDVVILVRIDHFALETREHRPPWLVARRDICMFQRREIAVLGQRQHPAG